MQQWELHQGMQLCLKVDMDTLSSLKLPLRFRTKPIFLKARLVPYALKDKVEQELQRLEEEGIIYKVNQSEWATPVVMVPMNDGSLRVCGDYKTTVNQSADVDQYPLPNADDLFATLAGDGSLGSPVHQPFSTVLWINCFKE